MTKNSMQTSFHYRREGEPFRWMLVLQEDLKTVDVYYGGEFREYRLPLYGSVVETRLENEYVYLTNMAGSYVQFKFEEGGFLVGDLFNDKDEHLDEFCAWVFGEDGVYDNPERWTRAGEHPHYEFTEWQQEVGNGDTELGYHEWVEHQVESNQEDEEDEDENRDT
jgi:hypothetical protein